MTKLQALKGSIKKWQGIVNGTEVDYGKANCTLCDLYFDGSESCCAGCPVAEKTGCSACKYSPYETWDIHHELEHGYPNLPYGAREGCDECKQLAQNELDFLKSLLPKKEQKCDKI